jgi:hypothetical protein
MYNALKTKSYSVCDPRLITSDKFPLISHGSTDRNPHSDELFISNVIGSSMDWRWVIFALFINDV